MNVDPEKFTELGISAIQEMAKVAKRNGQQEVEVSHPLLLLRQWKRDRSFLKKCRMIM